MRNGQLRNEPYWLTALAFALSEMRNDAHWFLPSISHFRVYLRRVRALRESKVMEVQVGAFVVSKENHPTIGLRLNANLTPSMEDEAAFIFNNHVLAMWDYIAEQEAMQEEFCKYFHFIFS